MSGQCGPGTCETASTTKAGTLHSSCKASRSAHGLPRRYNGGICFASISMATCRPLGFTRPSRVWLFCLAHCAGERIRHPTCWNAQPHTPLSTWQPTRCHWAQPLMGTGANLFHVGLYFHFGFLLRGLQLPGCGPQGAPLPRRPPGGPPNPPRRLHCSRSEAPGAALGELGHAGGAPIRAHAATDGDLPGY